MKLSWAARRRWSLVLLLVGLPVYIVAAVTIMNRLDRPGILVELAIYVALGVLSVPIPCNSSSSASVAPTPRRRPSSATNKAHLAGSLRQRMSRDGGS